MLTSLKNGAKLIAVKPARGIGGGYIVLAETDGYHPFVTWHATEEGHAGHGHYFEEQDEAFRDFQERR